MVDDGSHGLKRKTNLLAIDEERWRSSGAGRKGRLAVMIHVLSILVTIITRVEFGDIDPDGRGVTAQILIRQCALRRLLINDIMELPESALLGRALNCGWALPLARSKSASPKLIHCPGSNPTP